MTCLFRFIFKFPCPTCGVTRALLSILKGNVANYCYYNVMALLLLFATCLMFWGVWKQKKYCKIISGVILFINFPYYVYRVMHGLIP